MKATFYLHPEALRHNPDEPVKTYISKFSRLIEDLANIVDTGNVGNDTNEFIYSDNIFESNIFEDQNIYSFVYGRLDRDSATFLNQVLSCSGELSSFTVADIENKSKYSQEETECHALIKLNQTPDYNPENRYIQFERYELVYNKNSWLMVRRQILGNHPGTATEFMEKSAAYFPNIIFSDNCTRVVGEYLESVPRKIVYYLSCMNDMLIEFHNYHPNKNSINELLGDFAGRYGMDKAGTQQSTPAKKDDYTFSFNHNGETVKKRCGPHFKITHVDGNCQASINKAAKYHARIYFTIDSGKIFVGSIGPHI